MTVRPHLVVSPPSLFRLLVALVVLIASVASSAGVAEAGSGVAAISSESSVAVEAAADISPGHVGWNTGLFGGGVSGCCVAPRTRALDPAVVVVIGRADDLNSSDESGYFTAMPTAAAEVFRSETDPELRKPNTSTVNVAAGSTRANQVTVLVELDDDREFAVYALQPGDVVVDVMAYVTGSLSAVSTEGLFTPLPVPVNLATVRSESGGARHEVRLAGLGGVPPAAAGAPASAVASATLVVGQVVLDANAGERGNVGIYPGDVVQAPGEETSNVNALAGERIAALVTTATDPDGNVVFRVSPASTVTFQATGFYRKDLPLADNPPLIQPERLTWDVEQRLDTTWTDGEVTGYDYWPDGARVAQHHPNGDTTYYVGAAEVTVDGAGAVVTTRRAYVHAGVGVASRTVDGDGDQVSVLLGNHQGSITATVTAGVVSTRFFQPYGARRGPDPAVEPTTTGFLNQHEDPSGLVYLNNRYHDPLLGGFISVDPLVTTTWEPYIYGASNPISFLDPSGLGVRDFLFEMFFGSAVHSMIQAEFMRQHPDAFAEVQIYDRSRLLGRLDLARVDGLDLRITDIKPVWALESAEADLSRYEVLLSQPVRLRIPGRDFGSGAWESSRDRTDFEYSFTVAEVRVRAWRAEEGVIVYDYSASLTDFKSILTALLAANEAMRNRRENNRDRGAGGGGNVIPDMADSVRDGVQAVGDAARSPAGNTARVAGVGAVLIAMAAVGGGGILQKR